MPPQPFPYEDLNSKQKENYNFHKAAAILADYGFNSLRLNDDWNGADFLAVHVDGKTMLRVQLKGRLSVAKKYEGKDLHVGFLYHGDFILYPHDELLALALAETGIEATESWRTQGGYSWPNPPAELRAELERWRYRSATTRGSDA